MLVSVFSSIFLVSKMACKYYQLNATMPDGQTWERQLLVFGWQNSLYSSKERLPLVMVML